MMKRKNATLKSLMNELGLLQSYLTAGQVDHSLVSIIMTAMKSFASKKPNQESAPNMDYLLRISDELQNSKQPHESLTDHIHKTLTYLNFNSRQYFLYEVRIISIKLRNEETLSGKLELLGYEMKVISQIQPERDVHYSDRYPPLKEMIANWLVEEVAYLERKREINSVRLPTENTNARAVKLALDLSVAQLTCLIRGLIENKYILNNNLSELASFLSGVVVTKRSENISEGSFRRKYYNIEDSTKKSVIEVLNKTIDWLMKS